MQKSFKNLNFIIFVFIVLTLTGCAAKTDFMLQRSKEKKKQLEPGVIEPSARYIKDLMLAPSFVNLSKEGVNIYIKYLNEKDLNDFFENKERFGKFSGPNPYLEDLLVFYVKITNNSGEKIKVSPESFVVLDDSHSQYSYLNPDYIMSLYKARSAMQSLTDSTKDFSPGGIYGAPVDVASSLVGRRLGKKFIQLKTVELTGGYIHNGVIYDGLIAFSKPSKRASVIRLKLSDMKTKFSMNDEALAEVEFEIPFEVKPSEEK